MSVAVRPWREGDAAALAALHAAVFDPPQLGPSYWRARRNTSPNLCLVAVRNGALVGYCDGFTVREGGDVNSVAVLPAARRAGVGRALLLAFLREARERGASAIHLEVAEDNRGARALYESLGFERVGTRRCYYADGSDAAVLACRLDGLDRAG